MLTIAMDQIDEDIEAVVGRAQEVNRMVDGKRPAKFEVVQTARDELEPCVGVSKYATTTERREYEATGIPNKHLPKPPAQRRVEAPVLGESFWNAPREDLARGFAIVAELKQDRRPILDTLLFPVAVAVTGNLR